MNFFLDTEIVYTRADGPYKTLEDVIDHARRAAGRWGAANPASLERQAAERLRVAAGVNAGIVSHEGGGDLMINVLNGTLEMGVGEMEEMRSQLAGGTVRVLATFNPERMATLSRHPDGEGSRLRRDRREVPRSCRAQGTAARDHPHLGTRRRRSMLADPEYQASAISRDNLAPNFLPHAEYGPFVDEICRRHDSVFQGHWRHPMMRKDLFASRGLLLIAGAYYWATHADSREYFGRWSRSARLPARLDGRARHRGDRACSACAHPRSRRRCAIQDDAKEVEAPWPRALGVLAFGALIRSASVVRRLSPRAVPAARRGGALRGHGVFLALVGGRRRRCGSSSTSLFVIVLGVRQPEGLLFWSSGSSRRRPAMDQIAYFLMVFAASIGGLVWGVLGGSMPGHVGLDHHGAAVAVHLYAPPVAGDRDARVLLHRRGVWRLDSRDSDPHAGHERRGGDRDRRL